jgi:hypothetical protein
MVMQWEVAARFVDLVLRGKKILYEHNNKSCDYWPAKVSRVPQISELETVRLVRQSSWELSWKYTIYLAKIENSREAFPSHSRYEIKSTLLFRRVCVEASLFVFFGLCRSYRFIEENSGIPRKEM